MSYPVEVRRDAQAKTLQLSWDDGHETLLPLAYLRGWCPCAACQGHGGDKRYVHAANSELANIEVVGRYALQLRWGDGHETGIYTYRYLRSICPCPTCGGVDDP